MKHTTGKPSWLIALDKQIQRSKGSTKRQLQSLRHQQLKKSEKVSFADIRQDILNGNDGNGNPETSKAITDLEWTQRALSDSQELARKLGHERDAWMQRAIVAEQTISDWQLLNQ